MLMRHGSKPASSSSSQWVQLTNFTDAVAYPTISPDGRMLAFIRGTSRTFVVNGQVFVKILPDGEPVQLTHDESLKMAPAFSPTARASPTAPLAANGNLGGARTGRPAAASAL